MRTPSRPIIAVLGSTVEDGQPARPLRSRLDRTVDLWFSDKREPYIICLGGGDSVDAEAPIMATYLEGHGIPRRVLVEEAASRTTEENLLHLRAILLDPGFPDRWVGKRAGDVPDPAALPQNDVPDACHLDVTIVTSHSHIPRTLLMARSMGFSAHAVGSHDNWRTSLMMVPREIGALVIWGARSLRRSVSRP